MSFLDFAGVHLDEARTYHVVELVSLSLESLSLDISLLLGHHGVLVLPSIELLGLLLFHLFLSLVAQVQHRYRFKYEVILYLLIKGTISSEGCQAVNFDEPWFDFVVEEDIDSKNLKADRVFHVIWL